DGVLQPALTYPADLAGTARIDEFAHDDDPARAGPPGSMRWSVATGRGHLVEGSAQAEAGGLHAWFVVPLIAHGRTLGALAAMQAHSGRAFSPDDLTLVTEVAQRAAMALDNARLYAEAGAARRQAESANRAKDEFL